MGIVGLVLTVGGVALGWFISRKEKSVQKILIAIEEKQRETMSLREDVEQKKKDVEILKVDIDATSSRIEKMQEEINNDIEGLYQRLRREETVTLLKRLVAVPQDISNISKMLLARQLEKEYFGLLHKAYNQLMIECPEDADQSILFRPSYKSSYLLLFFQHYCGESLRTSGLKEDVIAFFPTALSCAFKVDVVNSTLSIVETLNGTVDDDIYEVLCKYLSALSGSKHGKYIEPYRIIATKCGDEIDLRKVWDKLVEQNVIIVPFGNQLCARYCDDVEFIRNVHENLDAGNQDAMAESSEDPF